jgi:hypothetical protein
VLHGSNGRNPLIGRHSPTLWRTRKPVRSSQSRLVRMSKNLDIQRFYPPFVTGLSPRILEIAAAAVVSALWNRWL